MKVLVLGVLAILVVMSGLGVGAFLIMKGGLILGALVVALAIGSHLAATAALQRMVDNE